MNIKTVDIVRDDTGKISVTIEPALERDGDTDGYTAEIDQTFRGNMEMCSAGI